MFSLREMAGAQANRKRRAATGGEIAGHPGRELYGRLRRFLKIQAFSSPAVSIWPSASWHRDCDHPCREDDMANRDEDRIDLETPLGISREAVPKDDRIHASNDEESLRRRRARALGTEGEDRLTDGLGDLNTDPDGAAGIDMGYGGEGTDVKPSR
jgi:hypothetical protein